MFNRRISIEKRIKNDESFSFSRWGDGEWQCILGAEGANCDGHQYFADLRVALANCLRRYKNNDEMAFGMQPKAIRDMGREIITWLVGYGISIAWYNADLLHDESKKRGMEWLHKANEGRRVILVGPDHLEPMARERGYVFVRVESKNAWLKHATVEKHLYRTIKRSTTILYCAGMMSKVLISHYHRWKPKINLMQIDCGSVFDPYVGVCSRRYHTQILERIKKEGW
jgi:hypothetical protein